MPQPAVVRLQAAVLQYSTPMYRGTTYSACMQVTCAVRTALQCLVTVYVWQGQHSTAGRGSV